MTAIKGYVAAPGFEHELAIELGAAPNDHLNRLFLASPPNIAPAWTANVWHNPKHIEFRSISDAATKLRALQRNWALHPGTNYRRSRLIAERLPHVSARPIEFGTPLPTSRLGAWTLLDKNTLIAATDCASPVPNGAYRFVENRTAPPNRAYLKLWEALTRAGKVPQSNDLCLDLGASPGGWTWVLANLGTQVISVDKAPLAPDVAALPNVSVRQHSAFALNPSDVPGATWLFSDIICYPARLLRLITRWQAAEPQMRFICTLKFQGETDFEAITAFKQLGYGQLVHLHHNKHELTWISV